MLRLSRFREHGSPGTFAVYFSWAARMRPARTARDPTPQQSGRHETFELLVQYFDALYQDTPVFAVSTSIKLRAR